MSLQDFTDQELRAELGRREEAQRAERWEELRTEHACLTCGADPAQIEGRGIDQWFKIPRYPDGTPVPPLARSLYPKVIEGQTWVVTVTCVNGHTNQSQPRAIELIR